VSAIDSGWGPGDVVEVSQDMSDTQAQRHDPYGAFRVPEFRAFWFFRLFVSTAFQIQGMAVSWQIYQLTHSLVALSMIGLVAAAPALGVSLFAGHVADVMSRRAILWLSTGLLVAATAGLSILSMTKLGGFLHAHPWTIYGGIFLGGLCRGFLSPAQFGLLGQIVPPEMYGNASAWNSTVWQIACIVGPALAGILYYWQGPAVTYALGTLLLLAGWGCLTRIHPPPARAARPEQSIFASIHEGLRFVFSNQVVLGAMALDLFAVLFGGAVALLPVYAEDILHTGAVGAGFLRAAPAVGSLIVGIYLSYAPVARRAGLAMMWNIVGFGLSMILFGISKNFYLSFLWLLLSGGFDAVSVFVRWTTYQIVTPDHMKGRVAAVSSIFVGSSNEIGEFETALVAKLMGVVPSVVFGGSMTLLVVAYTAWAAPKLRQLDMSNMHEHA
jgi:MFS family permease